MTRHSQMPTKEQMGVSLRKVRFSKTNDKGKSLAIEDVAGTCSEILDREIHPGSVSKVERGEIECSWRTMLAICQALDTPVETVVELAKMDSAPEASHSSKNVPVFDWLSGSTYTEQAQPIDHITPPISNLPVNTFAIRITDVDLFTLGKQYQPGTYLFLARDMTPKSGELILVFNKADQSCFLRSVAYEGKIAWLRSLTPDLPPIQQTTDHIHLGTVVCSMYVNPRI